jgi:hypothetical protein
MPLKKKTVKGFRTICVVRKYNLFVFVHKGPEHDKPVENVLFYHVFERFFHTEHILAETSSSTLIRETVFSDREFVAPCKKPDTAGFFFIEIGVIPAPT